MDLTLNKRGDYVVRAAICLSRASPGSYRKVREVAAEMDLPLAYTPWILKQLGNAGLAEARAGQQGGYRLSRPPAAITLLEVVEAAEGPLRPERCTLRGGPCHWDQMCAVHPTWEAAAEVLRETLAGTTLGDVARIDEELAKGVYPVPASAHRLHTPRRSKRLPEPQESSTT